MPSPPHSAPAAADPNAEFHSPTSTATTTLATLPGGSDVEKLSSADDKDADALRDAGGAADDGVPAPAAAAPSFPDGGRRAYLNTAGGVLVLFCTFGLSNSWAAFQAELRRNQLRDYPASSIAWIGSVQLFILFLLGLPSGRLFDQGWFRWQITGGSALWIFGMFMLSLSKTYYQLFLSYAVCMGIALGIVFPSTLSCVGSYFQKKRTVMMGCTAAGAALGAVIFPIMANKLFASHGFAFGVRAIAYIHVGLLLLANLLMRPRNDIPPRKPPPAIPLIASFLRQPQTWFACTGCAFVMLGMFIPIFYVQVFVQDHGASPVVVQYAAAILNGAACVARLTVGFAADRFGNLTVALPVTALIGAMIFAMLGATSTGGAVAFCVVFGAASGAWVTIMAPALISLSASVREFGVRAGLGFIFVSVATLIGSPVAGAILRATPGGGGTNYVGVCAFGGCAVLVGTGLLAAARAMEVKRRGTWRV
ncbi:hypothetical protein JCM10450v2_005651 [Rhodotorula kratochvilovae]